MKNSNKDAFGQEGLWTNWHKSINVGGAFQGETAPSNSAEAPGPPPTQNQDFKVGLQGLMDAVRQAWAANKSIRAYGSKWSLDNIAYNDQLLVNTWNLNYCRVGLPAEMVTEAYQARRDQLTFVQAGVFIRSLSNTLADHNLALATTGASDGQRIVGAISTGTHGSANAVGAMQEYVRGIHLVVPDESGTATAVYLQRASDATVTDAFGDWLGNARIFSDDDLFNAALVSFGSFGLIHGLLIEAVPNYAFEVKSFLYPYKKVLPILQSQNADELAVAVAEVTGATHPEHLPYHFELSLNPYRVESGETAAFVRVMQKVPTSEVNTKSANYTSLHEAMSAQFHEKGLAAQNPNYREELQRDQGRADLYGGIIQLTLHSFFKIPLGCTVAPAYTNFPYKIFSHPDSTKPVTRAPIGGTSLEISMPLSHWEQTVDLLRGIVAADPLAAPFGMRVVKPSAATLAFTRFEDLTVTIELPGPYGHILFHETGRIHQRIFNALAASNIPYALHWGQQMPHNPNWIPRSYGPAKEAWQEQRQRILSTGQAQRMFANQLTDELGLT